MTTSDETNTRVSVPGDFARFRRAVTMVPLPDEDRTTSPYTGLTRAHWEAVADDLLLSAARFRSPGGARIDLPGRPSQQGTGTDGLEGFARTFLLAAFRHVGSGGQEPHRHLDRYLEGVVAGTRTIGGDDSESWPVIGDIGRTGQPHVEAASIALSLHLTRADGWDRLAADEQDRIADWFRATIEREPSSNNWYLFPLTIASFLEGVGRGDDETAWVIERGIGLIDQWYRGDGWYSDGDGEAYDHYIGWALHLYPMLHARLRGDTALEARLGDRLEAFLRTFSLMFDRNGAPLHQGRSLTYRMATLAAVATGEVFGRTPLTHGQSRRILSADLRYFLERGATRDGVLTLGWHGEYEPVVQRYSGPGSPYWTSKGFGALMLPADHPVWTEPEAELPSDTADAVRVIGPIGWMVQATAADGIARVHNHGSDHVKPHEGDAGAPDPLYGRFAYSTRTGPTPLHTPSDNDLQVEFHGQWSVRRRIHHVASGPDWLASWHAPRFVVHGPFDASDGAGGGSVLPSVRAESVTIAHGRLEVRIHRFRNVRPGSRIRASGWAVAGERPEAFAVRLGGVSAGSGAPGVDVSVEGTSVGALRSQLVGVVGWAEAGAVPATYGTAYGRWAVLPELRGMTDGGTHVALASLTAAEVGSDSLAELAGAARVSVVGSRVAVTWTDDGSTSEVDLDAIPWG
jgi:hypothetical protein